MTNWPKRFAVIMPLVCFLLLRHGVDASATRAFTSAKWGARALGMGGAFVAVADDASALYWNPAGMFQLGNKEITSTYSVPFGVKGLSFTSLDYIYPTLSAGYFGIGWSRIGANNIIQSDSEGKILGTATQNEDLFSFSYAKGLNEFISLGINLKYLQVGPLVKASGYSLGGGILISPIRQISLGLMGENLTNEITLEESDKSESLDPNIKAGLAVKLDKVTLSVGLDDLGSTHYKEICSGVEIRVVDHLAIRGGLRRMLEGNEDPHLSFGASLLADFIRVDYACSRHPDLGYSHVISLGLRFGRSITVTRHFKKGLEHYKRGKLNEAIAEWENTLRLDPAYKQAYNWLERAKKEKQVAEAYQKGIDYYNKGMLDEAIARWERALEMDPKHKRAQMRLEVTKRERETFLGRMMTVAIFVFENTHPDEGRPNIERDVWHRLVDSVVGLRRFIVVEREELRKVMEEQGLSLADVIDEATAVRMGKLVAADMVVAGSVWDSDTGLEMTVRVMSTETAEIIASRSVRGAKDTDVQNLTDKLAQEIKRNFPILVGKVVQAKGNEVVINIGSDQGLRRGVRCIVYREGEIIRDLLSGGVLGVKKEVLGEIVVDVVEAKMAITTIIDREVIGTIKVGDRVRTK